MGEDKMMKKVPYKKEGNKVIQKVSDDLKLEFIRRLIDGGWKFGCIAEDPSVKTGVEFNLVYVDETMSGYEVKGKATQFALYRYTNGHSKRSWYDYSEIDNVFEWSV